MNAAGRCLISLLGLGWLAAPGAAWAQRELVQQFAGSTILLASGDTLRGPLTLHASRDLLLLPQPDNTVRTVAALAVEAFAVKGELPQPGDYFDPYHDFTPARGGYVAGPPDAVPAFAVERPRQPDTLRVRVFRTFRWNRGNDYANFRSPAFFEQLSRGPVMLLRRQSLLERSVMATDPTLRGYAYPVGGPVGYYVTIREQFFLGTAEGEVVPLRNPRRDLLAYFRAEAAQLEHYAKTYRFAFDDARELAYLVNYANALRQAAAAN